MDKFLLFLGFLGIVLITVIYGKGPEKIYLYEKDWECVQYDKGTKYQPNGLCINWKMKAPTKEENK